MDGLVWDLAHTDCLVNECDMFNMSVEEPYNYVHKCYKTEWNLSWEVAVIFDQQVKIMGMFKPQFLSLRSQPLLGWSSGKMQLIMTSVL